jgi:protein MAK11
VKSIDLLTLTLEENTTKTLLVTVSSDGLLNVHDTSVMNVHRPSSEKEPLQIEPIGSYDTNGTRLTCVTFAEHGVLASTQVAGTKRSFPDEQEDEVAESDSGSVSGSEAS